MQLAPVFPSVFVPSPFFSLLITQGFNGVNDFPESRAEPVAYDVLEQLSRLLVSRKVAYFQLTDFENCFTDYRGQGNRRPQRYNGNVVANAHRFLLVRKDIADNYDMWGLILRLVLLGLRNKGVAPLTDIFTFVHDPAALLCALHNTMNYVSALYSLFYAFNSVAKERLPQKYREVSFAIFT